MKSIGPIRPCRAHGCGKPKEVGRRTNLSSFTLAIPATLTGVEAVTQAFAVEGRDAASISLMVIASDPSASIVLTVSSQGSLDLACWTELAAIDAPYVGSFTLTTTGISVPHLRFRCVAVAENEEIEPVVVFTVSGWLSSL